MMLQRCELHAIGQIVFAAQDMMAVHCMLHIGFEVIALERVGILFKQPWCELGFADIMQEAGEDDIARLLSREIHPFGDDAAHDGHTQRVIVDIVRQMIQLVEIINGTALL